MFRRISSVCILLLIALTPLQGYAAEDDEPLMEKLESIFKNEYLQFKVLLQVVGDFKAARADDETNGVQLGNARLQVKGNLDYGFSYQLQTSLSNSPAILDARVGWTAVPEFGIHGGLFKTPFGAEFQIGADATDFINRPRFTSLVANRQLGIELRGTFFDMLSYRIGGFNGNRDLVNDDNNFMVAGRLQFDLGFGTYGGAQNALQIGANAAWSTDSDARWFRFRDPGFAGERLLTGGDVRLELYDALLAAEVIAAFVKPDDVIFPDEPDTNPTGVQATVGYMLPGPVQVLVRWDAVSNDTFEDLDHNIWVGINWWPTSFFELQLNYIYALDADQFEEAGEQHQMLVNAQIAW